MSLTPAQLCRGLLDALEASEGRRKRRARNTTPDSIGLDIQREILEAVVRDEPTAELFEAWLLDYCEAGETAEGPQRAMAMVIWDQWLLSQHSPDVEAWLVAGARSDDRETGAAS